MVSREQSECTEIPPAKPVKGLSSGAHSILWPRRISSFAILVGRGRLNFRFSLLPKNCVLVGYVVLSELDLLPD